MRMKVREISCRDVTGNGAVVVEWIIQADGIKGNHFCSREFSLEDGSPVVMVGGQFEHFYSGKLFIPVHAV